MEGLLAAQGPLLIGRRLAGSRPVLGVCVGMQVLFEGSGEPTAQPQEGLGEWPGRVERLTAPVVPHMGWAEVDVGSGSRLFAGVETERFYFVHSYAAHDWSLHPTSRAFEAVAPIVTHATHGERFVAAVENGPLSGTQFHPEKSGEAGLTLLENWIRSL
jgi:imidazole glycerol-phosphate synthase subunit HisH